MAALERENRMENQVQKKKINAKTFNIILYVIAAILLFVAAFILIKENVLFSDDETDQAQVDADIELDGVTDPDEIDRIIEQLIKDGKLTTYEPHGKPVDDIYKYIPVTFHFIDKGISCDIYPVGINKKGQMETVSSAHDVTWLSQRPYAAPGEKGNCVISGHNLWKGDAGTFSTLKKMNKGEYVAITFDKGFTRYFKVVKKYESRYNDGKPMKTEGIDKPVLTLITCAGDWSHTLQQSKTRVVVICENVTAEEYKNR